MHRNARPISPQSLARVNALGRAYEFSKSTLRGAQLLATDPVVAELWNAHAAIIAEMDRASRHYLSA